MLQNGTAWTKLPCSARTCPAPLQWGQVAFLGPLGGNVGPRTPQSLQELPKCGGQGTAWPRRSWVGLSCWALGIGTPHLCDSRRQKAPCQHCHPVLEGWWGSFKLFQTKTQKYISAITKQCPWLVPWRGWGGACWCGAFATCFPMALLLHQPPPDRVVVLAGPWAGRWGAQPPAGLLGEVEVFFFPATKGKTHAWNGSLQQRWQGSNGCPLHSGAPHLDTAACSNAYLGTAAHNAEVTPETADAAYASKARRVMSGKCW